MSHTKSGRQTYIMMITICMAILTVCSMTGFFITLHQNATLQEKVIQTENKISEKEEYIAELEESLCEEKQNNEQSKFKITELEKTVENQEKQLKDLSKDRLELHPCYLCGGDVNIYNSSGLYYVQCNKCGLTGPRYSMISDAENLWNNTKN